MSKRSNTCCRSSPQRTSPPFTVATPCTTPICPVGVCGAHPVTAFYTLSGMSWPPVAIRAPSPGTDISQRTGMTFGAAATGGHVTQVPLALQFRFVLRVAASDQQRPARHETELQSQTCTRLGSMSCECRQRCLALRNIKQRHCALTAPKCKQCAGQTQHRAALTRQQQCVDRCTGRNVPHTRGLIGTGTDDVLAVRCEHHTACVSGCLASKL